MEAQNLLYILSDQHNRNALGAYGHPVVQTPHLDALAKRGTVFRNAYTNCPICVPARGSLATGQYVHQIRLWDNAFPYTGEPKSWGHRLKEQGFRVDSVGKLHFRRQQDDNGFVEEHEPLHVVEGTGDPLGCVRNNPPFRDKRPGILEAAAGDSSYLRYDARNTASACKWLQGHAKDDRPWILFLSYVCPHPPFIAPQKHFDKYALEDVVLMPQWQLQDWPTHPAIAYFRKFFSLDKPLTETQVRQMNVAYYGLCSYLDEQIGSVVETLEALGLTDSTRIIYSSDHGESLGARGIFGKFTLYDEAAAVPLIMAGAGVPEGKVVDTPVSLVDFYPTVLEAVGATMPAGELPGQSLWQLANQDAQDRTIFSEYHALGSEHAAYMLRDLHYKYIYYVKGPPQLFDMENDPEELTNLAGRDAYQELVSSFEQRLRELLDPDATDKLAKQDQAQKIVENGGLEAVLARGSFTNSPTPDQKATFE